MYNINEVPKALKTLCIDTHGFIDNNQSLQKLWNKIVKFNSIDENDDIVQEFYEYSYEKLDTFPRGALLDMLAGMFLLLTFAFGFKS